jgi:hypothetical protein
MNDETATTKYRRRYRQFSDEIESQGWRSHWQELQDFFLPRKGRYLSGDSANESNTGAKRNLKIINGISCDSLRILAAGMQGGLTSPSRPWFRLTLSDQDLAGSTEVKTWLHLVRQILLNIFQRSNFYGVTHSGYAELAVFGTWSMLMEEDFQSVIRCRPFTCGEYMLGLDSTYRPDSVYRRFRMTVRQMVQEFGLKACSDAVQTAYQNGQTEQLVDIVHAIQPSDFTQTARRDMKYDSVYFEDKRSTGEILKKSGYRICPFVAPRWDVTSTDVYGRSPGMDALGDVKMLQKMEEKKLKALDKLVDPPMVAPSSMRKHGVTIVPGGINYVDTLGEGGLKGFGPAYQVQPDLQDMAFELDRVETRVRRFFFNDLFLSILTNNKTMTATEVAERHEEKLLVLGPVLERLQSEMLDPIIERVFDIALELGMLPPPPQALSGQPLKVEYISLLAQAQKLIGVSGVQQVVGFAVGVAPVAPEIMDKLDLDAAVGEMADMHGINPKIVRGDDEVGAIRQGRQQQMAAAAAMQTAQAGAATAKDLGTTPMGDGTALDAVNAQAGGVA